MNFTFQYGSTLIRLKEEWQDVFCKLYIPIWFYFNAQTMSRKTFIKKLYIPIWFYFNIRISN